MAIKKNRPKATDKQENPLPHGTWTRELRDDKKLITPHYLKGWMEGSDEIAYENMYPDYDQP